MTRQKDDTLAPLREQVTRIERRHAPGHSASRLATGIGNLDAAIGGGLVRGGVHEFVGTGADRAFGVRPTRFIASLLARIPGHIVWVRGAAPDLCLEGLRQLGLSPGRLVLVETEPDEVASLCEDVLRERGVLAMVADLAGPLTLIASRRLQLAAERGVVTGFLVHQATRGTASALPPSACQTRWRIGSVASVLPCSTLSRRSPAQSPTPGHARWQLELLRQRGGPSGTWLTEIADDDTTLSLRLAADVADRSVASPSSRPRRLVGSGAACA